MKWLYMDIPAKLVSNSSVLLRWYDIVTIIGVFIPKNTTYCQYKYELSKSAMKYTPKHYFQKFLKRVLAKWNEETMIIMIFCILTWNFVKFGIQQ